VGTPASRLISHKLANVGTADRIFVLQDGRIVEHGKHEELLKAGGSYSSLCQVDWVRESRAATF
jgi:ABC-type transport system involved in Fe-S cluster assembly fused permease/ATPase subunit